MSLWTFIKILAALAVCAVMAVTAALTYHIMVKPLDGVFSEWLPTPAGLAGRSDEPDWERMLEAKEMPDIDPGEKSFQKAHELLALGKTQEAREKLAAIVNIFPNSSSAPSARRILGEINLDEILSGSHMAGKQLHVVQRGESLLAIATRYRTSIDCLLHLNAMMDVPRIQPGDELLILPLDFRLLIEPKRQSLSLWEGGRFVREYPILHATPSATKPRHCKIQSKLAESGGRRVLPQQPDFRAADKILVLDKPALQIRAWDGQGEKPSAGLLLRPQDMEEIALLTRNGNEVEIR